MGVNLLRSKTNRMQIIAHAGGEAYGEPNSTEAINYSIAAKSDIIEIDVHATSDGRLAIGRGYRNIDYPLDLQDVLPIITGAGIKTMIDIKNGFGLNRYAFEATSALVKELGAENDVIISAWDHYGLALVSYKIETCPLLRSIPVDIVDVITVTASSIVSIEANMLTSSIVKKLHDVGIAVITSELYDANYRRAYDLGADAVTVRNPGDAMLWTKENVEKS